MNGLDGMVLLSSLNFALIMRIRHKISVPVKEENVETGSRPKRNEVKCERNWWGVGRGGGSWKAPTGLVHFTEALKGTVSRQDDFFYFRLFTKQGFFQNLCLLKLHQSFCPQFRRLPPPASWLRCSACLFKTVPIEHIALCYGCLCRVLFLLGLYISNIIILTGTWL